VKPSALKSTASAVWFDLRCHATLGEFDLIRINQRFKTLHAARAVAATLVVFLSASSAKLVSGGRWTITNSSGSYVHSGQVVNAI
jgi:hypothetical protein